MENNWVSLNCNLQCAPHNAVLGGHDTDGSKIYVARTAYKNEILTAKFIPEKRKAYISFWTKEIEVTNIDVLCENDITCRWVPAVRGRVPDNAVATGRVGRGDMLYVGRAAVRGSLTPGKVVPSKRKLYLPFGGREHKFCDFEVLVSERKHNWFPGNAACFPDQPVVAGHDVDGSILYVCRAYHNGDLIPGKAIPTKSAAYISYGGIEHFKSEFEVLCHGNNLSWQHTSFNNIPPRAVHGGRTANGEILYIGRTYHLDSLTPGKVQPSHSTLYIPFGGFEVGKQQYEILVENE